MILHLKRWPKTRIIRNNSKENIVKVKFPEIKFLKRLAEARRLKLKAIKIKKNLSFQ